MAKNGKSKRARLLLVGAAGVLVIVGLIVLITAFWVPPKWAPRHLDQTSAQNGVRKVLTDDYQAGTVTDVRCPAKQEVAKGKSFTCSAKVGGQQQKIKVTFLDDDGKYEVARPAV